MPTSRKGTAKKAVAKKTVAKKTASSSVKVADKNQAGQKGEDAIENDAVGTGPTESDDKAADARAAAAAALPGPGLPASETPEAEKPDVKVQLVAPYEEPDEKVESELVEKGFVYVHNLDPARQIPGTSKYLDFEQRIEAEKQRAIVEDREPDLVNPPSTQGTPFKTAAEIDMELPLAANIDPDVILEVSQVKTADADKEANDEKSEGNTSNLLNKRVGVNA